MFSTRISQISEILLTALVKVNLVDILEIDAVRRTVRCEPLVTMGQLTATLDSLGWTIPIGLEI